MHRFGGQDSHIILVSSLPIASYEVGDLSGVHVELRYEFRNELQVLASCSVNHAYGGLNW